MKKISWVPSETVTDIIDTLLGTDDLTKEQQKKKKLKIKSKLFDLLQEQCFPVWYS